ncbi:MAG: hypothetical protein L6244_04600 [Candidatus Methanoperedenaceae archaeon]|nr:hypothetical protein [Euryarchaeota archaeon]MCG2727908.1 hypothetical protein [Candidatus Methanoperedenaceae archaeon]
MNSVLSAPLFVVLAVLAVLVIKFVAGVLVPVVLGYPLRIGILVGVALSQVGEE